MKKYLINLTNYKHLSKLKEGYVYTYNTDNVRCIIIRYDQHYGIVLGLVR